ncbi:MAG: citrate/2-methylcitrate synthase [Thermoplasmata archaeon]|nr:citrate/2-methylcitrate synthase [Thermoplasmata archaeon]
MSASSRGLEGVVIGRSAITLVEGETGGLAYRGFRIAELVPGAPYESVIHLLLWGEPPSEQPPSRLSRELAGRRSLPRRLESLVDSVSPGLPPLEALRTMISAMGDGSFGYPPTVEQVFDLIARTPTMLTRYVRRSAGERAVAPRADLGHVANYLYMLEGVVPDPRKVRALEGYFVLLADHGMNASTFALRVVLSTNSDLVSAATAGLAALKGPLHGGAPAKVSDMLDGVGTPENAEKWIAQALARKERLMGFGHRAYKVEDPRAVILKQIAGEVADPARLALAERVESVALDALERQRAGRRLYTNVEYYGAVVLESVGLPRDLFTPTFALARTAGWGAHALEQAAENRLIRPDVEYVGPAPGRRWPERSAGAPPH